MALKWAQYLHREAYRKRKEILWLNLDETSVPVVMLKARGTLKQTNKKIAWRHQTKVKASHQETRMCFTLVAVICSDPYIQTLLPQVIFISEKHANWTLMEEIWQNLPPNVFVKRKSSGWTDAEQHRTIIEMIGKVLEPFTEIYQPVLIFDAVKVHLTKAALEELFIWLMWYLVVPKDLTYLCQPLDAHVFGLFKKALRAKFNRSLGAPVPTTKLAKAVDNCIQAIEEVLVGRDWNAAFEQCGYGFDIANQTSKYFKYTLEWERTFPQITGGRPTPDELRMACWPRDLRMDEFTTYLAFPQEHAPLLALPPPIPPMLALPPPPPLLALPPVPPPKAGNPTAKKSGKSGAQPPKGPPLGGHIAAPKLLTPPPKKAPPAVPKGTTPPVLDRIHKALAQGLHGGSSSSSSAAPKPPSGPIMLPPSASASSVPPGTRRYLKSQAMYKPGDDDDDS